MKKLLGIVVLIFSIMGFSMVCHAEDGLQVYYSFDTDSVTEKDEVYTIKDLSGNGYNGTSTESSIPILERFDVIDSICGKGKAVSGAVKLPNKAFENVDSSYTINFIGKYMSMDRTQKMLVLGDNYYSTPWGSGMCRLSTYHENGERWVEYQCNLPSHNKINMFTFICNEGTLDMYFNGNKIDKRYDNGDSSVIFSELAQDSENEFIVQNEYLDEFRLYNRALTDEEILMLYESVDLTPEPTAEPIPTPTIAPTPEPTVVPTTDLLLHYSFDADSVTENNGVCTIKDLSGNEVDAISVKSDDFNSYRLLNSVTGHGKAFYGAIKLDNEHLKAIDSEYTINFIGINYASSRGLPIIKFGPVFFTSAWGSGQTRAGSYYENNIERIAFNRFEATNDYNMYTFVYKDGNLEMYLNCDKITDKFERGTLQYTISEILQDSENEFIVQNEYLDEFRLYNRALTDEEIQALYEKEKYLIPEPTVEPTVAPTTEPTITPTDEPKTAISLSINEITDEGIVSCTIHNNTNEDIGPNCIIAVYDSKGELKGVRITEGLPEGDTSLQLENCNDASTIKVFLWDSVTGMKPQFSSVEYLIK